MIINLYVSIIITLYNKKSMIYPYWATHTLYIAFIGKIRAYVNLKDKLVEIVNEIIYFILVSIMIFFEDRHDWTKFVKYVYLALVLSNLFMTFVIGIVAFSAIPSTSRKNKIPGLASGKGINSQFGKNNNSTAEKQNLTDANSSRYQSGRNDIVNLRTHKLDGSRKKHLEFTAHKKNDPTGVMKLARYDANALKK